MEFKDKLLTLRQRYSMSQQVLADSIGISRKSIQYYELGERYPKRAILEKMAAVFNVSLDYLVSADELFIVSAQEASGKSGKISAEQLISNATAMFSGGEMSDEDKDKVMRAIQDAYWEAKEENKKYASKLNKKSK